MENYATPIETTKNVAQTATENDSQQPTPDYAVFCALQNEYVVSAKCFEYDGTLIVAVLTRPLYLKSVRDKCLDNVKTSIEKATKKSVIATFDVDVYARIKDDMNEQDKSALYKKVTARL